MALSATLSIFGAILGGVSGGRPIMPVQLSWTSVLDPIELSVNCPNNQNTSVAIPANAKAFFLSLPVGTTSRVWLKGAVNTDTGSQICPPLNGDPLIPLLMPLPNPAPASFNIFVTNGDPDVLGVKVLFW